MSAAEEILALELDPDHKHFMAVFTGKRAVISAILSATARVTPGRLRGAEVNHMDAIIEEVQAHRELVKGLH